MNIMNLVIETSDLINLGICGLVILFMYIVYLIVDKLLKK